MFQKR